MLSLPNDLSALLFGSLDSIDHDSLATLVPFTDRSCSHRLEYRHRVSRE